MIRNLKKKDFHWKNIPFILRFLNDLGQIKNRYQTRLPTPLQRKLAKTVKHIRNLGLLPFTDYIRPQDKMPFTSLHNTFYEETIKIVDPLTGEIKINSNANDNYNDLF